MFETVLKYTPPFAPSRPNDMTMRETVWIGILRMGQMLLLTAVIIAVVGVALLVGHSALRAAILACSLAIASGFLVGTIAKRRQLIREVAFSESLPPFAEVRSLPDIIEILQACPDRDIHTICHLLRQLVHEAGPNLTETDRKQLIDIAEQVTRAAIRFRVQRASLEQEPIFAAVFYHLITIGQKLVEGHPREQRRIPERASHAVA